MKNSDVTDPLFLEAVAAIDQGDTASLQKLLHEHPHLATQRLDTPNEGYFKNPYLLWFVADNPIRHDKLPSNIVEVAKLIIEVLQKANDNNYQYIIDYTLGLLATGRIPKECGVQIPLMDLLLTNGASVKGNVLGPIGQNNLDAASFLLDKGADDNLATAVGLGRMDDVKKLVQTSTASELYVALVVASFYGKAGIISLLLAAGGNVNGPARGVDFGGFHSHASALHQAVYSGSLEAVKLLVEAGADLDARDKAYGGTPLGWAGYMQTEEKDEAAKQRFKEIEEYLKGKQNT